MQVYPNLMFDGRCEAALKLYEECLNGKTVFLMTYDKVPNQEVPPDWQKKIFHATFALNNFMFSGSDQPPGRYQKPQGFVLQINLNDPEEAERIFRTLSENGSVQMPMQETFWALRFGVLVDQFNIPWIINCEKQ